MYIVLSSFYYPAKFYIICYINFVIFYLVTPQTLIPINNILSLSPTPQCHGPNPLYRIVRFPFGLELPAKP
jgi:hypothetical protein